MYTRTIGPSVLLYTVPAMSAIFGQHLSRKGQLRKLLREKGEGLHATPVSERPRAFNKWFATGGWATREGSIIIYNDRFERVAESSWRSTLIPFNEVQIPESRKQTHAIWDRSADQRLFLFYFYFYFIFFEGG